MEMYHFAIYVLSGSIYLESFSGTYSVLVSSFAWFPFWSTPLPPSHLIVLLFILIFQE